MWLWVLVWALFAFTIIFCLSNLSGIKSLRNSLDFDEESLFRQRENSEKRDREIKRKILDLKTEFLRHIGKLQCENPYTILDKCIRCGTCKEKCPVDAISESEPYEIDPALCTACGTCAEACPIDAIVIYGAHIKKESEEKNN